MINSASEKDLNRIKKIFSSSFILPILSAMSEGKRPSQIAKSLDISEQSLYYYTQRLRELGFIQKQSTREGVAWSLTEKGNFFLKEKLRRAVGGYTHGPLPFRFHYVRFKFQIEHIPDSLQLDWIELNHGVQKATLPKEGIEIIKSLSKWKSAIIISMPEGYFTNHAKAVISLYNEAQKQVIMIAERLSLEVSQHGMLISNPHMAFERDIVALFIADQTTGSIETDGKGGKAWIDSSNGAGELETNDPDYVQHYLMMPQRVSEINSFLAESLRREALSYTQCYNYKQTVNN